MDEEPHIVPPLHQHLDPLAADHTQQRKRQAGSSRLTSFRIRHKIRRRVRMAREHTLAHARVFCGSLGYAPRNGFIRRQRLPSQLLDCDLTMGLAIHNPQTVLSIGHFHDLIRQPARLLAHL